MTATYEKLNQLYLRMETIDPAYVRTRRDPLVPLSTLQQYLVPKAAGGRIPRRGGRKRHNTTSFDIDINALYEAIVRDGV